MIVSPFEPLPENQVSYTIGRDGPPPLATIETLSLRTAQQRDLDEKITICARLGVAEYILVDPSSQYLPQRLLLKRLQPDGTYRDEQDADGGITSNLGFRIVIESDGKVRVIHAATGWRYPRPDEAMAEARRRLDEAKRRPAAGGTGPTQPAEGNDA